MVRRRVVGVVSGGESMESFRPMISDCPAGLLGRLELVLGKYILPEGTLLLAERTGTLTLCHLSHFWGQPRIHRSQ